MEIFIILPATAKILREYIRTYTGPGTDYIPLWSLAEKWENVELEEIRLGEGNVFWGRLKNGYGWIDLRDTKLYEY